MRQTSPFHLLGHYREWLRLPAISPSLILEGQASDFGWAHAYRSGFPSSEVWDVIDFFGWDEQGVLLKLFSPLDTDERVVPVFHGPLAQATLERGVVS